MFTGGDVGDDSKQKKKRQEIRKEMESMEKLFGLTEESRVRKTDKKSPKCKQFVKECEPGLQACKNLFSEFIKHIPPGEEQAKGK